MKLAAVHEFQLPFCIPEGLICCQAALKRLVSFLHAINHRMIASKMGPLALAYSQWNVSFFQCFIFYISAFLSLSNLWWTDNQPKWLSGMPDNHFG